MYSGRNYGPGLNFGVGIPEGRVDHVTQGRNTKTRIFQKTHDHIRYTLSETMGQGTATETPGQFRAENRKHRSFPKKRFEPIFSCRNYGPGGETPEQFWTEKQDS